MIKYILHRILLFIPTLFVISFLAFIINNSSPGDPVEIYAGTGTADGGSTETSVSQTIKDSIRAELRLDKPVFYFSLGTLADCDTLYKIPNKKHRKALHRLTRTYGNWLAVSEFYSSVNTTLSAVKKIDPDSLNQHFSRLLQTASDSVTPKKYSSDSISFNKNMATSLLMSVLETGKEEHIRFKMDSVSRIFAVADYFREEATLFSDAQKSFNRMTTETETWKNYVPDFSWQGFDNQYHFWISRLLLHGDFGYSYYGGNISERIWEKFFISFKLIFLSVLIAYLLSIPIGTYSAWKKGKWFDRSSSVILFMMYSLPSFFVGILLLWFFANPDYFSWFPESGYADPATYNANWPFWQRWAHQWPFMILPLITYTYSSLAFISRVTRVSVIEALSQDYIRTARAKGLNERTVVGKHALRNSLLPVITMFVNIFPLAIGGSVIIETIFSYPGMGLMSYEAIHSYDYPGIVAVFTLAGFLTMLGYLAADILYAIADPRISYTKKSA